MNCWKCNKELESDWVLCPYCGEQQDDTRVQGVAGKTQDDAEQATQGETQQNVGKRKKLSGITLALAALCVVLAAALILVLVLPGGGKQAGTGSGMYFKTPEDAANYFVKCINEGDTAGALQAFYIDEKAEKLDFQAMLERLRTFRPYSMMASSKYQAYIPLNEAFVRAQASMQIKLFLFSLLLDKDIALDGTPIIFRNGQFDVEEIEAMMDTAKLKDLKLVRMDYACPDIQNSENFKANMKKNGKYYGHSGQTDYTVLYDLNGVTYMGGFLMVQTDKGWKIDQLGSQLGNLSPYGTAIPVTNEEYLAAAQP